MTPEKPYEINPSAVMAQAPVLLRQILLVLGGMGAVFGFLSARDIAGLWAYLQSEQFVPVFMAAAGGASLLYGQWKAHRDRVRLVVLGKNVPDDVAVVKEPTPPPAVDTPGEA